MTGSDTRGPATRGKPKSGSRAGTGAKGGAKGGAKQSAARLAAVQALYQVELTAAPVEAVLAVFLALRLDRSEERRVGKECRCRWTPNH